MLSSVDDEDELQWSRFLATATFEGLVLLSLRNVRTRMVIKRKNPNKGINTMAVFGKL